MISLVLHTNVDLGLCYVKYKVHYLWLFNLAH